MTFAFDFNAAGPQALSPGGSRLNAANDQAEWERRLAGLRETLRKSAEAVFRDLFPHGETTAKEGRIGDVRGEHGESLKVDFVGEGAGLWRDHATGEGGDLIALYEAFHGCTFPEAVEGLEGLVGLSYAEPARDWVRRTKERAERQAQAAGPKPYKRRGPHWDYLSADGSRVLARVVRFEKFHAVTHERIGKTFGLVVLDAKGGEVWEGPEVRPLYNLPGIVGADTVALVEGEKCADALAGLGVPATCIIGGANADLDKVDWAPLRGKRLILWGDNDAPGREFVRRLQSHLVGMPCAPVMVPEGKPEKWDAADCLAEGGADEARALLGQAWALLDAMPAPANGGERRKLLRLSDLRSRPAPRWLIQGMIPERSYSVVVGDSETMKSFAAIGWAVSIAYGRGEWLGRALKSGAVVYVAGEGQAGILKRLEAHLAAWGLEGDGNLYLYDEAVDMPGGNVEPLLTAIREDVKGAPVVLIVLDTLAQCFGSGDENAQADMNAFNNAVKRLQAEAGAAVLAIHHLNRMGGARGSTNLRAALDVMMLMEREGRNLLLRNQGEPTTTKQKDAAPFEDLCLTYDVVPLGQNEDGDPVSSVVLRLRDTSGVRVGEDGGEARPAAPERPAEPTGPLKQAIFRLLREYPDGLRRQAVLQELRRRRVRSEDHAVDKAMRTMKAAGFICHDGSAAKVWTVREGETAEPDG